MANDLTHSMHLYARSGTAASSGGRLLSWSWARPKSRGSDDFSRISLRPPLVVVVVVVGSVPSASVGSFAFSLWDSRRFFHWATARPPSSRTTCGSSGSGPCGSLPESERCCGGGGSFPSFSAPLLLTTLATPLLWLITILMGPAVAGFFMVMTWVKDGRD